MSVSVLNMGWPEPKTVPVITHNGQRAYDVPGMGPQPSVTTVLKMLAISFDQEKQRKVPGADNLINWAAKQEREAVVEAAAKVYAESYGRDNPNVFISNLAAAIGIEKAHQKAPAKAGDIGTAAHGAIKGWLHARMSGTPAPDTSYLPEEARTAFLGFLEWFQGAGLEPVRLEQPVWSSDLGYAGTIDLVARHKREGLGVVDFKTGKYVYDESHCQVAAYLSAGRTWAPLKWGKIVRLPKTVGDSQVEVKPVGLLADRNLTEYELMTAFIGALAAYRALVWRD
jgi:hypothetical protein